MSACVPHDMLLVVVVCVECVNMSACVPNDMLLVVVVCAECVNMSACVPNAGVGKLFMIEGRMGLQRACRRPDRYKSHNSTHS